MPPAVHAHQPRINGWLLLYLPAFRVRYVALRNRARELKRKLQPDRDSVVQAEVIATIPKASLVRRLGRFRHDTMRTIDERPKVSLGLS